MISLACAGWGTFVLLWVFVITIIINRGDTGNTVLAQTAHVTPPPATSPGPVTPQANTSAQVPTPTPNPSPRTATPPTPQPANPTTPTPTATTPTPTPTVTPPAPAPTPTPPPPALSEKNPFGISRANVLGFQINPGHTAVLLDAIERSQGWMDDGKAALISGLTRPDVSRRVSLVTTSDGQVQAMPTNPFSPGASKFTPLNNFLRPVKAVGKGGLGAGLTAAIDTGADEVVFITSRSGGWGGYLNTLRGMLKMNSGSPVKLHIIQIGESNNALRQFVENECQGTYLLLSEDQLRTWRRESR